MRCPKCSTDNAGGQKFCGECGGPLALTCAACGSAVAGGQKFCGECGTPMDRSTPLARPTPPAQAPPVAERRTVSVLFADLVGFTPMSESRDPEEVRELLSRYFEVARTTVLRYGGVVEKFIGDAVMAVWGVPSAHEDDAERAVRAGLDLIPAIAALATEAAIPELQVRGGVVTGEVAVTLGATGQGMVAGDAVNTAARVQAQASPGSVWVDEVTRHATMASIAYADAGRHQLKGKAETVHLFSAQRVVAGAGGAQRLDGLEAPFTGRDRELLLVKELFHACAEESRARLVSITGIPGIGKTRLAWEFFKYLDGVASLALWHVGRCLSYGEGVAYRALAEVVRMRLRIVESDAPDVVRDRLRDGLAEYVADPEDRVWLEPRLAILLGLSDAGATFSRDDLFAAWRLFFERLTDRAAVVIVVEDVQWADDGLLDFVDYLLDWSAESPIYVLTLARPEIAERRPGWGSGRRNATSLHLEPLHDAAMRTLVGGLVGGLPDRVSDLLVARAEGVPLYAVETVRMLIDRDIVVPREGRYELVAPDAGERLEELDVPASLQALVAARIDGLSEVERRVLSDAAVLGQSFTRDGLEAVLDASGSSADLDVVLPSLARKGIFGIDANPRSPERGHYRFMQAVLRQVPYDTMSRRDRKIRHLAVAAHLGRLDNEELVAVIASHYLDAAEAVPSDPDAVALTETARDHLIRAADRAASLGAPSEARRYYERALGLAAEQPLVARLSERVGIMVAACGDPTLAVEYMGRARSLYESIGDLGSMARVAAQEGEACWDSGRSEEGLALMEPVFAAAESLGPHPDLATLAASIGKTHVFLGHREEALIWTERAATLAEHTAAWRALVRALNYRAITLMALARPEEARGLLTLCIEIIRRERDLEAFIAPFNNMSLLLFTRDLAAAREIAREGLELARRRGDRGFELYLTLQAMAGCMWSGEWDEAEELGRQILASPGGSSRGEELVKIPLRYIRLWRGDLEGLRQLAPELSAVSFDQDLAHAMTMARGMTALGDGRLDEAAATLEEAFEYGMSQLGPDDMNEGVAYPIAISLAAGRVAEAESMLARLAGWPVGARSPYLTAQMARLGARLAVAQGRDDGVEEGFSTAVGLLEALGMPYHLAEVRLEEAEWLAGAGRAADARELAGQALVTFERLGARPSVDRATALLTAVATVDAAT